MATTKSKKKQLNLLNGCSASYPFVSPSNWKTGGKELLNKNWFVQYYFRDPIYKAKYPKGKPVRIKKMNSYKTLEKRRFAAQLVIDSIIKKLTIENYNPITDKYMHENVSARSGLIECLRKYTELKIISKTYKEDITSMINKIEVSVFSLSLQIKPVNTISRRDIKSILRHQQETRGISNHRYNKYKCMLSSLFDEMIEDEVIDYNPTYKIKKLKEEKKIRETLSENDRRKVYAHLKENFYTFWRFMMIYFSSGARVTELLKLKVKDIDLSKLEFKVTVKKGVSEREVIKPINKNYLYLWIEAINEQNTDRIGINPEHFLFSKGLQKGEKNIRYEQITRRWKVHVKEKLEITSDFAALTHLYADNVAAQLDIEHAQRLRSHTTDRMMLKHYAVNEKQRQLDRLKNIQNPFYTNSDM